MGRASVKKNKNIYQLTREELGYSREKAADLISYLDPCDYMLFDESRLVKIEHETVKQIYPDEIVTLAEIYNKPELRNHYCCNECAIGKIDAPKVAQGTTIEKVLVNLAVSLKNVNHQKIRLMEILNDKKLVKDEADDFKKISDELEKISESIEAFQLWCEKVKIPLKK